MHCSSTWPCVKVREIDTGMSPTNLFQKFGQQNESTHQRNITWKIIVAFSQNSRLTWLHRRTLIISHVIPAMMCQTAEPATERRLRGHREGFCYSQSRVEKSHLLITYQPSFISYIQFHGPKKKTRFFATCRSTHTRSSYSSAKTMSTNGPTNGLFHLWILKTLLDIYYLEGILRYCYLSVSYTSTFAN